MKTASTRSNGRVQLIVSHLSANKVSHTTVTFFNTTDLHFARNIFLIQSALYNYQHKIYRAVGEVKQDRQ